jgi:organic radical activating enzyme
MKLLSYWKLRKLKKGITICITPSFICNYNCSYCIVKNGGKQHPHDRNRKSAKEWIEYIESFPLRITEVIITGGEPTSYSGLIELVKILLDKKYFVTIYTNLSNPWEINKIPISKRLLIIATFHHEMNDIDDFKYSVSQLNHNLKIDEISYKLLQSSNLKRIWTIEDSKNIISCLRVGPDGKIFTNCFDLNENYLSIK